MTHTFTADQISSACADAGLSDSQCESLLISLHYTPQSQQDSELDAPFSISEGFESFWQQQQKRNGAGIGADFRHWAELGYRAAFSAFGRIRQDSERDAALKEAISICESVGDGIHDRSSGVAYSCARMIRAAMAAHQYKKSPPLQFVVMGDSESSPDPMLADMHDRIKSQGEKGGAK